MPRTVASMRRAGRRFELAGVAFHALGEVFRERRERVLEVAERVPEEAGGLRHALERRIDRHSSP